MKLTVDKSGHVRKNPIFYTLEEARTILEANRVESYLTNEWPDEPGGVIFCHTSAYMKYISQSIPEVEFEPFSINTIADTSCFALFNGAWLYSNDDVDIIPTGWMFMVFKPSTFNPEIKKEYHGKAN